MSHLIDRPSRCCALLFLVGFLCLAVPFAPAEVRLPSVISSNMVLQHDMKAPLWGWAGPGERIEIMGSWGGTGVTVEAGADGRWRAALETPGPGGPYQVTIKGKDEVTLQNVMIGEVWLCSGQSNMEMPIGDVLGFLGVLNFEEEAKAANYPDIRFFNVANACQAAPQADCSGQWRACTPESAWGF
ncbi:MAG: sialate O-acetylesterase, partial [Planctomycetota bacterium]